MKDKTDLDFTRLQVIDDHCHLFNIEYAPHELAQTLSMSLNAMPDEQLRHTLVYRRMLRELRILLDIKGADQEILAAREIRMRDNYKVYVEALFNNACIHTVLVDLGYKPVEVSLEKFEELVPARVRYIYRIESALDPLWDAFRDKKVGLKHVEDQFTKALENALENLKIVAIKSVIGYRTGLHIEPVDRKRLSKNIASEKEFRDYFLLQSIEKATGMGLPVQIHAAFGESNINVLHNNPALLKGLLDHPEYQRARIVLVHGGYPYCFEAGYLGSIYPNVYVDLSEMIPFAPMGLHQGLRAIFDMCPFNKILYGSDGFVIPEIHWLGAKSAKEALSSLFSDYMTEGLFDRDLAVSVAKMVFFETAQKLYGLEN